MSLASLPDEFRETAETLRRYGAAEPAIIWTLAAERVAEELEGHLDEPLSLEDAAIESGYTVSHLRRLIRDGTIPTGEDKMILRRHLPKKPGTGVATNSTHAPSSRVQLARTVAGGG